MTSELTENGVPDDPISVKVSSIIQQFEELNSLDHETCVKVLSQLLTLFSKETHTLGKVETSNKETQTQYEPVVPCETVTWDVANITDEVKSIAEQTISESGFVFDRQSGSYYNASEQCYYIPDYKLYYYVQSSAYYSYDEESQCLKFHSCVEPNTVTALQNEDQTSRNGDNEVDREEGECSSDEEKKKSSSEAGPSYFDRQVQKMKTKTQKYAPCIRFIVKETQLINLAPGTLFIVTCTGGTLGREGAHDIIIPDINVSKFHSRFQCHYREGQYVYEVVDVGSRNGTYLNGQRLSKAMKKSDPVELCHGNTLTVGSTVLLCHIHIGYETCEECEPGCNGFTLPNETTQASTTKSLKEQHAYQSNKIRKKFGLFQKDQFERLAKYPKGYEDKSEVRRITVGSSHSSEKTEVASTSIPINKKNKGYSMLSKMGWQEGQSVGKSNLGITAPIEVTSTSNKRGLGAAEEIAFEMTLQAKTKAAILDRTRKRFKEILSKENNDEEDV